MGCEEYEPLAAKYRVPVVVSGFGLVLHGVKKPHDCPAFGKQCTPEHPLGATMVSAEGACAACYAYGRHLPQKKQPAEPGAA